MDAKKIVNLIQIYRHDLLNHLQVIQGYVKLGKLDRAEANMSKLFDYPDKERELIHLNIPHVFLWFFEFKMDYQHLQLTYTININKIELQNADMYIKEKLVQIMQDIEKQCNNEKIYEVHVEFKEVDIGCIINVLIDIETDGEYGSNTLLKDINVIQTPNNRIYSFEVSTS